MNHHRLMAILLLVSATVGPIHWTGILAMWIGLWIFEGYDRKV